MGWLWRVVRVFIWIVALDVVLSVGYVGASHVVVRPSNKGQAIAVLWGDEKELDVETERRIEHAVRVWRSGELTQLMFCIGGKRPQRGFFGAQVITERLVAFGVSPAKIRVGSGSNDTVLNLAEIADVARLAGVVQVVVVSDPLQAMRAKLFLPQPDGLVMNWSPYGLRSARPSIGLLGLWGRVHYEWMAVTSFILPEHVRRCLIDIFRK